MWLLLNVYTSLDFKGLGYTRRAPQQTFFALFSADCTTTASSDNITIPVTQSQRLCSEFGHANMYRDLLQGKLEAA